MAEVGRGLPQVPGYVILGELGRGGMGVVYRAPPGRPEPDLRLKMILAGAHAGPEAAARFLSEAEAVARLEHPTIVQIHHIGDHDGLPYSRWSTSTAAASTTGATAPRCRPRGGRAGGGAGPRPSTPPTAGHRPPRPQARSNVLLTRDGRPKITDFGLAKLVDAEAAGSTGTGSILGTPSYMAPEQAGGDAKGVGPAADVYALGAILYELLTGRPPFRGVRRSPRRSGRSRRKPPSLRAASSPRCHATSRPSP